MSHLRLPLLLLILCHSSLGQRRTLITLRSDDGIWLSLKEIVKGKEYWLRPSAVVESARPCETCRGKNDLILSVRLWDETMLNNARASLILKGLCEREDPCRVTPYQAERLVLRDALQKWRTLTDWIPVGGMVPEMQEFLVGPTQKSLDAETAANFSLTSESLSSLHVSVVSTDLSGPVGPEELTFTGEDLVWAYRLLKTPGLMTDKLIDRRSLRKLSTWLLKMKARDMNGALPLFPALMARLERQLTVTSVKFRRGMKNMLPKGYVATEGEQFYVLRKIAPKERISITLTPSMRLKSITMVLKLSPLFKFSDAKVKPLIETKDESVLPSITSQASNLSLTTRLQILEVKLTKVMKLLNISNSLKDYPDIPLLRRQVSKIAKIVNATHIMDRENINLVAIDDCYDVKKKKMEEKVYFLRSIMRPVLCTAKGDTVVLKRTGGKVNFNESWVNYEKGLGNVRDGDFFIGLKDLSTLTQNDDMCMILLLSPWKLITSTRKATYDSFRVAPSSDKYRLSYSLYNGNLVFDVISMMNNQRFSTYDNDNDDFVGNCAKRFHSGNWFQSCLKANIFGPYQNNAMSGMCSVGIDSSQGDMCSPLASVKMILRKKANADGSRRIVFSDIAASGCKAKIKLFNVTTSGLYRVTIGGAQGGRYPHSNSRLGGRGATVKAEFYLLKGTQLGISAGCQGPYGSNAGYGGDASWLVSRSKKTLLAVAGGGGGASRYASAPFIPGMHGRATADGGDSWWQPGITSGNTNSTLLIENFGSRAKGWSDLRYRLLYSTSGNFGSGGVIGSSYGGGGGGGFQGGIAVISTSYVYGGGGGGSYCNSAEMSSCAITEGSNTRPYGFVIIERSFCF